MEKIVQSRINTDGHGFEGHQFTSDNSLNSHQNFAAVRGSSKLWGMFTRRERWGLSWRGRGLLALALLLVGWALVLNIHPFLAVTHRVPAKVLVVEGWTHVYGVDAAVQEFKSGHYERILTTGGPVEGIGTSSSIYDTDAWQSARLLKEAGIST